MKLNIETEQEEDGRWLAEVTDLPGVIVYGPTREQAIMRVQALALRVPADRIEHGEEVLARIAKRTGLRPEDL
jgi:predicted RNase H-like HicB family nuclease